MECAMQLLGYCTAQPTQKTLFQGAGKECPNNCQASDSEGAMQIQTPWPWNSGPAGLLRISWEFAYPVYLCFVDIGGIWITGDITMSYLVPI